MYDSILADYSQYYFLYDEGYCDETHEMPIVHLNHSSVIALSLSPSVSGVMSCSISFKALPLADLQKTRRRLLAYVNQIDTPNSW